jgi:hypothetical protein
VTAKYVLLSALAVLGLLSLLLLLLLLLPLILLLLELVIEPMRLKGSFLVIVAGAWMALMVGP